MHLCTNCHRHIRERRCPFCGTYVEAPVRLAGGSALYVGMKRSAILATVLAASGCAASTTPGEAGAAADSSPDSLLLPYGIPPPHDAAVSDVQRDAGPESSIDPYGIPPADASFPDGPQPPYGIPPGDR